MASQSRDYTEKEKSLYLWLQDVWECLWLDTDISGMLREWVITVTCF